jgi:Glyoxalase-like domain
VRPLRLDARAVDRQARRHVPPDTAAWGPGEIHVRQANAPEGFADVVAGADLIAGDQTPRRKVVFSVADRDETGATATRLGAEVIDRRDLAWTREAELRDPQGAELTISQFAPPDSFLQDGGGR